jgi:hypothetical protein
VLKVLKGFKVLKETGVHKVLKEHQVEEVEEQLLV